MRFSFKVIVALWIGLLASIGILLFNAYSRLKPEAFVAVITREVQKNYPGSKLDVGTVDYRFSLDFNLNLKAIKLRRAEKILGSIGEVELIVPWWLLLTSKGSAQVNLSDLVIHVEPNQHKSPGADRPPEASAPTPGQAPNQKIEIALPDYLSSAQLTLRAKNVSVVDSKTLRNYFTLSKLLVREFHYGKNSAFELNVPVEITHKALKYTSELWLFGDVTPDPREWKLNFRGDFKTRDAAEKVQLADLVLAGTTTFKPQELDLRSRITLLIEREQVGESTVTANARKLGVSLDFTKLPLNYFTVLHEEIKNSYLTKFEGDAKGFVRFEKTFSDDLASLTGKLSFPGEFQLTEKDTIPGTWDLSFQDSKWDLSFQSPKDEARFSRKIFFDLRNSLITQYAEELRFRGLDLDLTIRAVQPLSSLISAPNPTPFSSVVKFEDCLQADKVYDGSFAYGASAEQAFYKAELSEKTNSFRLNYAGKPAQNSLSLSFDRFPWAPGFAFLDPYFRATAAVLNGKVEGRWKAHAADGDWLAQLRATGLADAAGAFPDSTQKLWSQFEVDGRATAAQTWDLASKNRTVKLNSLTLEGPETFKLFGTLSPDPAQRSTLSLVNLSRKESRPTVRTPAGPFWPEKESL